jgi:hypothetical protein
MKRFSIAFALAVLAFAGTVLASPILEVVTRNSGFLVPSTGPWPLAPEDEWFSSGPRGQMTIGTDEAPPFFPHNIPAGTEGYGGQFLWLAGDGSNATIFFTQEGHGDAVFNNEFVVGGGCAIDWRTGSTPIGTSVSCSLPTDQLIPFYFIANDSNGPHNPINDGIDNGRPTFSAPHYVPSFGLFKVDQSNPDSLNQGTSFWIGLADGGATPGDVDYQDQVIRVGVSAAPEPATLALVGLGLAALAVSSRRKS